MTLWEYILLFASVLLGGGIALLLRENRPVVLRMLLSFSGAYILGIAAIHLLPGIYTGGESLIGLWMLGGFFIQILLEQLSRGVEHGHVHAHRHADASFGLQILLGLCLHSFIEGMPLSGYPHLSGGEAGHSHVNHLLVGIILHKAPAAFALVIVLLQSGFRLRFVLSSLLIFAAMSPLGALLGEQFAVDALALNRLMAVVVGSFLHISTTILFEADDTHHHLISWWKLAAIVAGFTFALSTLA